MNVNILDDGSAIINEMINTYATDGTEFYYGYVENEVKYSDFSVFQEGKEMQYVPNWNIDASLEEKSGKWGFNYTGDNKYELCFGKGHMGSSRYVINYKVTPFVNHYADDKYGFNYNFYESNFDDTKFALTINIFDGNDFEHIDEYTDAADNDNIWAFGFRGEIEFRDGSVIIPEVQLSQRDRVIVMMQLKGEHNINAMPSTKTFEEVKNTAFVGSNYKKAVNFFAYLLIGLYIVFIIYLAIKARSFFLGIFFLIWGTMFFGTGVLMIFDGGADIPSLVSVLIGIIIPPSFLYSGIKTRKHYDKWKSFIEPVDYYRDCPKDLSETYAIVEPNAGVLGVGNANVVGAYIMEMIKDKNLDVASEEKVKLFGRVETNDYITFENPPQSALKLEIYNILRMAAGKNELLEANELSKYASTQAGYDRLHSFFENCEETGRKRLKSDEQIVKLDTYHLESYSDKGLEKLKELIGLQKYFRDFTLLEEREIKEVHNWGEMLVYATFLNVAKTVMERLKIVIPEFSKEASEYGKLYKGTYISDYFGRSTMNGFSAREAQIAQEMRSSGGGGSSSFGGGGGFSGGGHGGGSR